ncbi:nucleoid-associated protein [Acinetobacter sp. CFCC 10889]|uniref:nucleoid-associated protein n=1 Tax=Acinetobacter sp. CFCC 10889 TaxID=1775557 RepID=UPI000DCFD3B2|nr:nucleoid-associated protein [Acinetobacter sp. CFCC 10889]
MSEAKCDIKAFIVHKLIKDQHGTEVTKEDGPAVLAVNDSIQQLMDTLNKRYIEQGGRSFGKFEADTDNYPISTYLTDAKSTENADNFYNLSTRVLTHLVAKAKNTNASGGWVVMSQYKYNGSDLFSVAIVNEVTGAGITKRFEVEPSVYIDLSKLRHAGRINLSQWKDGHERYVSFIRNTKESTYFKNFLGCSTTNSNIVHSQELLAVIDSYCEIENLDYNERTSLRSEAYNFLQSASKANKPIFLEHLANHLSPEDPDKLRIFLTSDEHALSDEFIPDLRVIKGLIQLKSKSKYWDLKFNREAFKHGMEYDPETGELKIKITDDEEKAAFAKEVNGLEENESD